MEEHYELIDIYGTLQRTIEKSMFFLQAYKKYSQRKTIYGQ